MVLHLKRVYDEPAAGDGFRVLVDRIWPRGVSRERADLGLWLKEVAPSNELRTWFGHQPDRFDGFRERYAAELDDNPAVAELRAVVRAHPTVTLLYGAKDTERNQAVVLADYLANRTDPPDGSVDN